MFAEIRIQFKTGSTFVLFFWFHQKFVLLKNQYYFGLNFLYPFDKNKDMEAAFETTTQMRHIL